MSFVGAYPARRAAALSGVPLPTVYWWARQKILVPSISETKRKLWSFQDLMALRVIYWLRRRKTTQLGCDIPATSMASVRQALDSLKALELPLWSGKPSVLVNGEGRVYIETAGALQTAAGQLANSELLNLIAPFSTLEGAKGPDLDAPRPQLRIVPEKLSGSPHILGTRLETQALASLISEGMPRDVVLRLYPYLRDEELSAAVDLEAQLNTNLNVAVAA